MKMEIISSSATVEIKEVEIFSKTRLEDVSIEEAITSMTKDK